MMKSLLDNTIVNVTARMILGFIFVAASIDKIADPNAFAVSIGYYKLIGAGPALWVATILPWLELLCGLFLLFGVMLRGSSLLAVAMLVLFTAGVLSGMARGLDISCGCFTRDPDVGKIGWLKVLENVGLIVLGSIILFARRSFLSLMDSGTETDEHA